MRGNLHAPNKKVTIDHVITEDETNIEISTDSSNPTVISTAFSDYKPRLNFKPKSVKYIFYSVIGLENTSGSQVDVYLDVYKNDELIYSAQVTLDDTFIYGTFTVHVVDVTDNDVIQCKLYATNSGVYIKYISKGGTIDYPKGIENLDRLLAKVTYTNLEFIKPTKGPNPKYIRDGTIWHLVGGTTLKLLVGDITKTIHPSKEHADGFFCLNGFGIDFGNYVWADYSDVYMPYAHTGLVPKEILIVRYKLFL